MKCCQNRRMNYFSECVLRTEHILGCILLHPKVYYPVHNTLHLSITQFTTPCTCPLPSSQHPAPVHYPLHNTLHLSITHFTIACTCPLPSSQQFTLFHSIFTIQYNIWNYFSLFPALQIVPYVTTGGLLQPLKQRVTSKYSSKHDNLLNSLRAVSDFVWSAWISVTF